MADATTLTQVRPDHPAVKHLIHANKAAQVKLEQCIILGWTRVCWVSAFEWVLAIQPLFIAFAGVFV